VKEWELYIGLFFIIAKEPLYLKKKGTLALEIYEIIHKLQEYKFYLIRLTFQI